MLIAGQLRTARAAALCFFEGTKCLFEVFYPPNRQIHKSWIIKISKTAKMPTWRFLDGFWTVFGWFWAVFGQFLGSFWWFWWLYIIIHFFELFQKKFPPNQPIQNIAYQNFKNHQTTNLAIFGQFWWFWWQYSSIHHFNYFDDFYPPNQPIYIFIPTILNRF